MIKTIILAILMLLPKIVFSQEKPTYVVDSYHNRDCRGGSGFCVDTKITKSELPTTASVLKIASNRIEIKLQKNGFSTNDWDDIVASKVFVVNVNVLVDAKLLLALHINTTYNHFKIENVPVYIGKDYVEFQLELSNH